MTTPTACPSVEYLKRFRLGLWSEAQSHPLEQHLAGCPSCLERLATLAPEDALVQGLRAQRSRPRLNNPLLAQIQREMRTQRFRLLAGELPTPASQDAFATLAEVPFPAAFIPASPGDRNSLEKVLPFLSPPKMPGEMGWLGPFRVIKILGEGGMGIVLEGEDLGLHRRVALKVMKRELAEDSLARQRFLREARAIAALEHENIITIHRIDEANGVPYLAMPLLQGESLEDRLRREELLPVKEVLRIGRETALGLAAAHEKGLIHRDIKPGNLWLEAPSDRIKILDFGLAAMPYPEGEKTLSGMILGTPGYMAPEQTKGQADPRADLFSLGCVLYRIATGQKPFKGDSQVEKIRSTLFDTPQPPQQINSALPAPLCHLIQRLLSRSPEERPTTALAVARVLETIESQRTRGVTAPLAVPVNPRIGTTPAAGSDGRDAGSATPNLPPAVPMPRSSRNRRWLLLGAGSGLALLIAALLIVMARHDPSSPAIVVNTTTVTTAPNIPSPPPPPPSQPPEEIMPDANFIETWVLKPGPIKGLKGWSIEANEVGRGYYYPAAFQVLSDGRLFIRFRFPGRGFSWNSFDPKPCGLGPAPHGGNYDVLTTDARQCAQFGNDGVNLSLPGMKDWITLRGDYNGSTAAFSPDGSKIVTGRAGATSELDFWDARKGFRITHCSSKVAVLFNYDGWSPDSKTLAVPEANSNGVILFRAPWKTYAKKIARPNDVRMLAWSPDGKYLATVETDKQVHVIDVELGEVVADIRERKVSHDYFVPAWSPDGKRLAFGTEDKKVVVWNLAEKKSTFTFLGHTRLINAVVFLPDNKTLVSGSEGGVRFWDLEKYCLRGTLLNLGGHFLAIGTDGNYRCSEDTETRFVIKTCDESGQMREFPPRQFRVRYGSENHPERVKLTPD